MTDFLAHPDFGIAALTPGQKAHLALVTMRMRPTLRKPLPRHRIVAARYLPPDDDGFPPPAAPAVAIRRAA